MLKRTFDILFGLVGLLLILPVLLTACVLIVLFDRQNPLFTQQRLGRGKFPFTIVKLRTMRNNKITRVGGLLRKTGMDELPQLVNILQGDMSFVGPRPLTADDVTRLGWNDDYHAIRWHQRPGITGLAQLSPVCNKKMSWFLDKKYVDCSGLLLDTKILFSSFAVLFVGKKRAIKWIYSGR